jgi:hypothetical protein
MHISYKLEVNGDDGRIVRVENFTRFVEVTKFHRQDVDLANRVCLDLTNALNKVGILCPTNK